MLKTGNPFIDQGVTFTDFDFTKVMGDMSMPEVDVDSLVASQRKNFEAFTMANRVAVEGFQAIARRQAEIVRSAMEDGNTAVSAMMEAKSPTAAAAKQAELTKKLYGKALANVRELTDIATDSSDKVMDVLNKRVEEGLDEVKSMVAKNGKAGAAKAAAPAKSAK